MDQVTTPPSPRPGTPGHNTSLPPGTRSQHLPPPKDQVIRPPSLPWDQVTTPPSPRDQVTVPPPWDQVKHFPSPWTRSQPPPPPRDQVITPPSSGPGHNTSLPPRPGHNTFPPPGTMRRRAVRILLECILV